MVFCGFLEGILEKGRERAHTKGAKAVVWGVRFRSKVETLRAVAPRISDGGLGCVRELVASQAGVPVRCPNNPADPAGRWKGRK